MNIREEVEKHGSIAQATKAMIRPLVTCLNWYGDFWRTWSQVYRGDK